MALTVFKRHANIGGTRSEVVGGDLRELMEMFVLLISLTAYIEVRCLFAAPVRKTLRHPTNDGLQAREEAAEGIWRS